MNELSQSYGFCRGQHLSIETICTRFPELATRCALVEATFNLRFGTSAVSIEDRLSTTFGDKWATLKADIDQQVKGAVVASVFSRSSAEQFLDDVGLRAKGTLPSPMAECLLTFHPVYCRSPAAEIRDGFTKSLDSQSLPLKPPERVRLQVPQSWSAIAGSSAPSLFNYGSCNGHGFDSIDISTAHLPDGYSWGKSLVSDGEALDLILADPVTRQKLMPEALIVESGPLQIAERRGIFLVIELDQLQVDLRVRLRAIIYLMYSGQTCYRLTCGSGGVGLDWDSIRDRHKRNLQMFRLVANSLQLGETPDATPVTQPR